SACFSASSASGAADLATCALRKLACEPYLNEGRTTRDRKRPHVRQAAAARIHLCSMVCLRRRATSDGNRGASDAVSAAGPDGARSVRRSSDLRLLERRSGSVSGRTDSARSLSTASILALSAASSGLSAVSRSSSAASAWEASPATHAVIRASSSAEILPCASGLLSSWFIVASYPWLPSMPARCRPSWSPFRRWCSLKPTFPTLRPVLLLISWYLRFSRYLSRTRFLSSS